MINPDNLETSTLIPWKNSNPSNLPKRCKEGKVRKVSEERDAWVFPKHTLHQNGSESLGMLY